MSHDLKTTLALVGASAMTGYFLARWLDAIKPRGVAAVQTALPAVEGNAVIPLVSDFLTVDLAMEVCFALQELQSKPVVIVLHTLGGPWFPAMQIARAIRRHGRVTALIPFFALSGGTFIALACRTVQMWPDAALGPIDPQLGWISANTHIQLQDMKPIANIDDRSILLAIEAKKAVEETASAARELGVSEKALARLMGTTTTHSHPIAPSEAVRLGLPVEVTDPSPAARRAVAGLIARELER